MNAVEESPEDISPLLLDVPAECAGQRLDQALAALIPAYSRVRLQQWVKAGAVTLNGAACRCKDKLAGGEVIQLELPPMEAVEGLIAEDIPLEVVFADASVIVLNKPAGLVVHPAVGNWSGTLLNGLLFRFPELSALPRAGIVHRLDKDTSGLMVVARTLTAHKRLVAALEARTVHREYRALVEGQLIAGGTVDAPIGRHPVDRKRMAVVPSGKAAITHYRVAARYSAHTLLAVRLETGRTHQIRAHMAHIQHPVAGDPVYGGRPRLPRDPSPGLRAALGGLRRQMLHAARLEFLHPEHGELVGWDAPLPADFVHLLQELELFRITQSP